MKPKTFPEIALILILAPVCLPWPSIAGDEESNSSAPADDADPRFFSSFHRFGIHLFFAVDGNAVARNIFLDGNTFQDSHSVDKKPFVADLIGGIGMIVHRFKITYSYVHRTKEFETQKNEQDFGAFAVSFTF